MSAGMAIAFWSSSGKMDACCWFRCSALVKLSLLCMAFTTFSAEVVPAFESVFGSAAVPTVVSGSAAVSAAGSVFG